MATRNIVPRADGEGTIGTTLKKWLSGFFKVLGIDNYIDLNTTTNPSHQEGRTFYDSEEHALSLYNENSEVTHNLGRELLVRVKNLTGSDIDNGKAVYINGSNGAGVPTIALAQANLESTSQCFGLTTCIIPNGGYGYVTSVGKVNFVDTSMFSNGDILYVSDTEAGGLTTVKPSIAVIVGYVILATSGANGVIFVYGSQLGAVGADMLKSVYDINDNGIVDKSETLNDGSSGDGNEVTASDARDHLDNLTKHREINDSGIGVTDLWSADKIITQLNTKKSKEIFFKTDQDSNYGNYRVQGLVGGGTQRFTFRIPSDFNSVTSLTLIFAPTNTIAGGQTCDLDSDYGAVGENYAIHSESVAGFPISGNANEWTELDISSVFTSLSAGDLAGFELDLNSIGTSINILGILLKYS